MSLDPKTNRQEREAEKAKETGEETVILTALCGHGHGICDQKKKEKP